MMMHVARSEAMLPLVLAFATAVSGWSQLSTPLPADRQSPSEKAARAAKLRRNEQVRAVRAILDDIIAGRADDDLDDAFFYHEDALRLTLRDLSKDPSLGTLAVAVRASNGDPHSVEEAARLLLSGLPPGELTDGTAELVACSLPLPDSIAHWTVLERAASNEYNDRWVEAYAIQTLKLTASQRSLKILVAARERNPDWASSIDRAIEYIRSNPGQTVNRSLEELAERVAKAITWRVEGKSTTPI